MKRDKLLYLWILTCIFACSVCSISCNTPDKPPALTIASPKKTVLTEPFRYHKLIEVSPGQDYDILSWGRGSSTVGAFEILHSDSAAVKYTTTTGDLDGTIIDVFNTDMDLDGNPEILIEAKGKDTVNYTHIYAFEFTNSKAEKLEFPRLTQQQRQGYHGGDNFYVKDGKLEREFQIYSGTGQAAKPTGQNRQLEYGLRNNEFTVKQLTKDSTALNPVAISAEKKKENNSGAESAAPKKHTAERRHQKKHRGHHNDEG